MPELTPMSRATELSGDGMMLETVLKDTCLMELDRRRHGMESPHRAAAECGADLKRYTTLQVGEPRQMLEVDIDMLSPDFYTIMTTSGQGSKYDTFISSTHGTSLDQESRGLVAKSFQRHPIHSFILFAASHPTSFIFHPRQPTRRP